MGDNLRWFKVWTGLMTDPDYMEMSLEQLGRWTRLGVHVAQHGTDGSLSSPLSSLAHVLRCKPEELKKSLDSLPNVSYTDGDGRVTVTYKNWHKYQKDSSAERTQAYRERIEEEPKDKYLSHVYLSKREHDLLIKNLGEKDAKRYIAIMDEKEATKGYGYRNHYLMIMKWYREDKGDTSERREVLARMKEKERQVNEKRK